MDNKPEILAPAGSMQALKAAVCAGADAVYLGGDKFGARAYADNFDTPTLLEGIEYCHLYGVKVYLTINTLFRNAEMDLLYDYLLPFYEAGLDAVIVQDLGVMYYVHMQFPDLPIHASTQMTITTPYAYELLRNYGVTRVVPARELSLEELSAMKNVPSPPELEVFVQGALCYCYSGQCLMSSFLGGRSGNRGRCAQPCRLPYKAIGNFGEVSRVEGDYLLSPRDLCGLDSIGGLIQRGIDSFKIEGRMKKPEYVAACVRGYRTVVDAYYEGTLTEELIQQQTREMAAVFNRGGFTKGYYNQHNGKDMMSTEQPGNAGVCIGYVKDILKNRLSISLACDVHKGDLLALQGKPDWIYLTSNLEGEKDSILTLNAPRTQEIRVGQPVNRMQDALLCKELENLIQTQKVIFIDAKVRLIEGEQAALTLFYDDKKTSYEKTVIGEIVQPAKKQPLDRNLVLDKICQLGDTRYRIRNIEVELSGNAFVPVKALKDLRRTAFLQLEKAIISSYRRKASDKRIMDREVWKENQWGTELDEVNTPVIEISSMEQWKGLESYKFMKDVYLDLQYFSVEDIIELLDSRQEFSFYIALPAIMRKESIKELDRILRISADNLAGVVVRNLDTYAYLWRKKYDKQWVLDSTLYAMNDYAAQLYREIHPDLVITLPVELNEKELMQLGYRSYHAEIEVYGYQQLMVSAQCICKNAFSCNGNSDWLTITDRYQKEFYGKAVCKYCYNLIYNGLPTAIWDMTCGDSWSGIRPRLHFTRESREETIQILNAYMNKEKISGQRTKGHFNRGVE